MRADTRLLVDRFWADLFGLTVEELHAPGTKAIEHVGFGDWAGVYVLILGSSVVLSSPREVTADFTQVHGPSLHSYLDIAPEPGPGVRVVGYEEVAAQLKVSCGEGEWNESGLASGRSGALPWRKADGSSRRAI
jgi:hypothetical protein